MTPHQGPYKEKPDFPVPDVPGWKWLEDNRAAARGWTGWGQVRDGSWYAFYCNVGPSRICEYGYEVITSWNREHDLDPNWWWRDEGTAHPGRLVCRHGAEPGNCHDGSCGPAPQQPYTEEDVTAAKEQALSLLNKMEAEYRKRAREEYTPHE